MKSNISQLSKHVKTKFPRCQNWHRKIDGYGKEYRLRCRHKATSRIVISMANGDCMVEDRCEDCATSLRQAVASGSTVEILDDQSIGRIPFSGNGLPPARPVTESETYF